MQCGSWDLPNSNTAGESTFHWHVGSGGWDFRYQESPAGKWAIVTDGDGRQVTHSAVSGPGEAGQIFDRYTEHR